VNGFNLCTDTNSSTGSGTMWKSEHTYFLMKGVPKDDDWRFFSQLMYNNIDILAEEADEVINKMKAHKARQQQRQRQQ